MNNSLIKEMIFWCGLGHFVLCAVSIFIPKTLGWKHDLQNLRPLLRQMFWTYAVYILAINIGFGCISIFGREELVNGTFLAKSLTLFITLYWLARIVVQFSYFDRSGAPKGLIYVVGEIGLVSLFSAFAIIYAIAFHFNIVGI